MDKNKRLSVVIGSLFILLSFMELVLCFFGPIVLDVKSTIFIFPFYSISDEPDITAIKTGFSASLSKSRKYIVIKENYAETILSGDGIKLSEIIKSPSSESYAEITKRIGAEKFTMGYIWKSGDGYEFFVNVHLTKQIVSVIREKLIAPDADALIAGIPGLVTKLDGGDKIYSLPEILYFYAIFFHIIFGLFLLVHALVRFAPETSTLVSRIFSFLKFRTPELLMIIMLLLFIFSYIYALNANMDYVQKFIATSGKLNLAQNTTQERLNSAFRYLPLIILNILYYILMRIRRFCEDSSSPVLQDFRVTWALPFTILSALLASLSLPSFLDINGWPVAGYICLIPFFLVIEKSSYLSGIFYGVILGMFNTVITSYWLGTFNLVSLQIVMIIFLISYLFFMVPGVWIYKRAGYYRFLVFPTAWVAFDYLQSLSFAGYPWGMIGASQYGFLPLIQVSAFTGVWGVTFIVVLVNAFFAHGINLLLEKRKKNLLIPFILCGSIFLSVIAAGFIYLVVSGKNQNANGRGTVRIAQIQDNMDPRKHTSDEVLDVLMRFTDEAIKEKPDLVVWPEGSFDSDYIAFSDYLIVKKLRTYQQKTGTWLLTGSMEYKNKDYAQTSSVDDSSSVDDASSGNNAAIDRNLDAYNSAMLLAPDASVKQHYYKIHLVPFTEYFPYEKELPWMYKMLKEFDITWWSKGEERNIFGHPAFTFFTPICYEDVFPGEIALFVRNGADRIGADAIMNLSNDFWSLSPVQGRQHAIDSLFRAVENGRPLLRTTTSGLTCYIDINGRIIKSLPHFTSGYYVVDVPLPDKQLTFYTMAGDWFPWFLFISLVIFSALTFTPLIKREPRARNILEKEKK